MSDWRDRKWAVLWRGSQETGYPYISTWWWQGTVDESPEMLARTDSVINTWMRCGTPAWTVGNESGGGHAIDTWRAIEQMSAHEIVRTIGLGKGTVRDLLEVMRQGEMNPVWEEAVCRHYGIDLEYPDGPCKKCRGNIEVRVLQRDLREAKATIKQIYAALGMDVPA